MKLIIKAAAGACLFALAACGGHETPAAENVAANADAVADNMEATADNMSNGAAEEAMENNAAAVRDASGRSPESVGPFPGQLGAREAVFQVGPGRHEFSGPDVRPVG